VLSGSSPNDIYTSGFEREWPSMCFGSQTRPRRHYRLMAFAISGFA
jgi:hypothetical protein